MEEEVTQRTIALSIKAAKLTEEVLKATLRQYLNAQKQKGQNSYKRGKQTVKELIGQNAGVSNLELNDGSIKEFEKVARKYGIDYAVKKDRSQEPPRFLVFFKARDADAMNQAFKEFVSKKLKQKEKPSIREKLAHFRDVVSRGMNRERARENMKDRGQSL